MAQDASKVVEEASSDSRARPDVIRAQIEQTRVEMTETIDAIQDRLSPSRLVAHAKDTVREATVGRVKHLAESAGRAAGNFASRTAGPRAHLMRVIRENPIPAALLGVGVTAALLTAFRRRHF